MAKVLLVMRATTHFHFYASIVEALLERGEAVEVLFGKYGEWWSKDENLGPLQNLKQQYPNFSYSKAEGRRDSWRYFLFYSRGLLNYHRNLNIPGLPRYFRDRVIRGFPFWLSSLLKFSPVRLVFRKKFIGRILKPLENFIPPDRRILEKLKSLQPQVLVASAGNLFSNSVDVEYLKAAQHLEIKTVIPVISWDYLSTKGAFHIWPDLLLCWNSFHKREAVRNHNFSEERIKIAGSPFFDKWFKNLSPSSNRSEFCSRYGLDSKLPIITYLGSSPTITGDESWVIKELSLILKDFQIILRSHPANWKIYQGLNFKNVRLIPPEGGVMPDTQGSLQLFFDTLYHSLLAVGINTSAILDAIVLGKPAAVLLLEKYRSRQAKTSYFQDLLSSGAVEPANNFDELLEVARKHLEGRDESREGRERFILEFIRPWGKSRPAGEVAAEEIEALAKL